jgi:hypothetical protein
MRNAKFYLDCLPDHEWDGFTEGDDWNGWACPYFTEAEALRLNAALVALATAEGHLDDDTFDIRWSLSDWRTLTVQGQPVYGVGAYDWTWSEITTPFGWAEIEGDA